jgi:4-hydroxy-tetrahydrodipicolinate synthase
MFEIRRLRGVVPALASPLLEDGTVDEPGVRRLVERVIAGGVHGLLPLGSTGEVASLDERTRRSLLAIVVDAAAARVPVICGVAQTNLEDAISEVSAAAEAGAVAALVAPPFYYPTNQVTVLAFYRRLAASSQLPVMIYNIPQFTKVVSEPSTVALLAREGAIVGIKDSSRDFEYFERLCVATRDLPDFRLFTGSDSMLLASLAMGGTGTICAAANVAPRWVVDAFEAFERGDWDSARRLQDRLVEFGVAIQSGVFPTAFKAALHLQGVCEPWPATPLAPLDERAEARLREQLAGWGLLAPVS